MMAHELCQFIRQEAVTSLECAVRARGDVRVRTQFRMPDRDLVDVFVVERDGQLLVTDYGEGLGWLQIHAASGKLSATQQALIGDLLQTLDVNQHRGQLQVWCPSPGELVEAIHRVGQAVVRIADLRHTFRWRTAQTISDEVDEWLRTQDFGCTRRVRRQGHARLWTVDYEIIAGRRTSLVNLLSSGSSAAAKNTRHRIYTQFSDLRLNPQGPAHDCLISLIDDTHDVWTDEDFRLLKQVSRLALWSQPTGLEEILTTSLSEDWDEVHLPQSPLLFGD